jgi:hypothetical protein
MRRANKNYNFTKYFCKMARMGRGRGREFGFNSGFLFPNFQNQLVLVIGNGKRDNTKLTLPKTAAKILVDA